MLGDMYTHQSIDEVLQVSLRIGLASAQLTTVEVSSTTRLSTTFSSPLHTTPSTLNDKSVRAQAHRQYVTAQTFTRKELSPIMKE